MTRAVNQVTLDLIKSFEGFSPTAYLCPAGVPTIGYGHTRGVLSTDVGNRRITEAMAEQLLLNDLDEFQGAVQRLVRVPLSDDQFGALVSFSFNVGVDALEHSSLLRLLNTCNYAGAAGEFHRWNHAGGVELKGLTRRRKAEEILFNGGPRLWPRGDLE